MKRIIQIIGIAGLLSGCASYVTTQQDLRYDPTTGKQTGAITTKVSTRTVFNAKSDLAKSAVTQTEKSQSSKVGSISQESTNSSTIKDLLLLVKEIKGVQ